MDRSRLAKAFVLLTAAVGFLTMVFNTFSYYGTIVIQVIGGLGSGWALGAWAVSLVGRDDPRAVYLAILAAFLVGTALLGVIDGRSWLGAVAVFIVPRIASFTVAGLAAALWSARMSLADR